MDFDIEQKVMVWRMRPNDRKEHRTEQPSSAFHSHLDDSHFDIVVGNAMVGIAVSCKEEALLPRIPAKTFGSGKCALPMPLSMSRTGIIHR